MERYTHSETTHSETLVSRDIFTANTQRLLKAWNSLQHSPPQFNRLPINSRKNMPQGKIGDHLFAWIFVFMKSFLEFSGRLQCRQCNAMWKERTFTPAQSDVSRSLMALSDLWPPRSIITNVATPWNWKPMRNCAGGLR